MKLIKNNQEAYMGWHDGHPIWDRGIDKLLATPFYVESRGEAVVVTFEIRTGQWPGEPPYPHINPKVEYSFDGISWATLPTLDGGYIRTVTIPANGRLYIRITGDRYDSLNGAYVYLPIIADKPHNVGGNVMSLLYGSEFMNYNTIPRSNALFRLLSMPSYTNETLIDASSLILPATTLTAGCYNVMFRGCVNMVSGPVLPATTLVSGCYMGMFEGCTSLNNIRCLATDISAHDCLFNWVDGVATTGTFTKKAGVNYPSGKSGIPEGWTVVEV